MNRPAGLPPRGGRPPPPSGRAPRERRQARFAARGSAAGLQRAAAAALQPPAPAAPRPASGAPAALRGALPEGLRFVLEPPPVLSARTPEEALRALLAAAAAAALPPLRRLPRGARKLAAGGFAGALGKTATAPLEALKLQLVGDSALSVAGAARRVYARRGVLGFWAGNQLDVFRTVPSKAIELAAFEAVKAALLDAAAAARGGAPPPPAAEAAAAALAGAAAGAAAAVAVHPLETVRTRMAVRHAGFAATVAATARERAFFAGLGASLAGGVPYAALRLGVYDGLKRAYKRASGRPHLGPRAALACGAAAGVASAAAVFPLEVARRRAMLGAAPGGAGAGAAAAVAAIARAEGVGALFNGVWLALAKQGPQYAVGFWAYEAARRALEL